MKVSVFVKLIDENGVVEASNGSRNGPPFVRFKLSAADLQYCTIGKRYDLTVEEARD